LGTAMPTPSDYNPFVDMYFLDMKKRKNDTSLGENPVVPPKPMAVNARLVGETL